MGRQAAWVASFRICASTIPTAENRGSKRFNYIAKTTLCHSDYIIYLWLVLGSPEKGGGWSEPAYRLEYTDSEGSFYTAESVLGQRVHCVYRHLQNVVLVHEKL